MKRRKTYKVPEKQKAVFFDRDGTINSDEGHYYIYKPEDFVFNPGVIEGMKKLKEAGYLLFVITNQGGIAKGIYTHEDVKKVHARMLNRAILKIQPCTNNSYIFALTIPKHLSNKIR